MLIGFFVAEAPTLVKRLHKAAAAQSCEELHSLAHNLKGLAANVNANAVRRSAQQLEDDAREQHIEDVQLTVADLQIRVERAATFLRQSSALTSC
jgi:HPt (histidine-containing phosphotransfer) domain-containing protein